MFCCAVQRRKSRVTHWSATCVPPLCSMAAWTCVSVFKMPFSLRRRKFLSTVKEPKGITHLWPLFDLVGVFGWDATWHEAQSFAVPSCRGEVPRPLSFAWSRVPAPSSVPLRLFWSSVSASGSLLALVQVVAARRPCLPAGLCQLSSLLTSIRQCPRPTPWVPCVRRGCIF